MPAHGTAACALARRVLGRRAAAAAVEVRAIPLDELRGAAGERPEVLVDAAVEVAQRAERHALRRLVIVGQLGRAAGHAVELAQVERAHGRDPERRGLGGGRQLVVIAAIAHEHVHAPDPDPEGIATHDGHGAGDEPRCSCSRQRALREPRRQPAGFLAERVRLGHDRELRAHVREQLRRAPAARSRPASDIAWDEIAATIAMAASRQRPTCSCRRQAKNDGAQVSFWP